MSGGTDKTDWTIGITNHFADLPHTAELLFLDGQTDEETLRQKIAALKPDRVVAVGGDGTLKCVAEQLIDTTIALGVLPAGSANGMARELGIPPDVAGSLAVLTECKPKPIDVISVNDSDICLHLADIGLNAQLVKHYQQNNLRGKFGYLQGVVKVLQKRRLLRVKITVGD